MDLKDIRKEIDKIDDQIIRLYAERMQIITKVAEYKQKNNLPVSDEKREQEKLADLSSKVPHAFRAGIQKLYSEIFRQSRAYQTKLLNKEAPRYGLLGRKLKHSFSPQIHSFFYDTPYDLYEIEPEDVPKFMHTNDLDAMNVTIPYKQTVIPFCAEISDVAKKIGSVNTIVRRKDGTLYGDNSDYFGFSYLVQKSGITVYGKKVIILGSGGSCLTVQSVMRDLGASKIIVISRSGENNYENISLHHDTDIIVNTTPVGMYPETGISPIILSDFRRVEAVFDLIYNPSKTKLLQDAEALKIPAFNGLPMLVAQAKKSAEIFCGKSVPDGKIDEIVYALERHTLNIVLIGMPGCGKSTVGKILSEKTGREFFDTDFLIEQNENRTIPQIIEQDGIDAFRQKESAILKGISKQSSKIIATGGGIVTVKENFPLLRQNSIVFFIDRNLEELSVDGRPLSQAKGVETLYDERIDLYQLFANHIIKSKTAEENADKILEVFGI
ncbi:MAG: chorismate mutase [Clostridia bacterium]|nr:chorismate mutase [Clostridia bacterium]